MRNSSHFYSRQRFLGMVAGFVIPTLALETAAQAQYAFEVPAESTTMSGIGIFSGWVCDAETVQLEFEGGIVADASYGTERNDTEGTCGDTDNGFGFLYNFALLGTGSQTVKLLVDGEEIAERAFNTVATSKGSFIAEEDLESLQTSVTLSNFPASGHRVVLSWNQALQNFVIAEEIIPGAGTGAVLDDGVVAGEWNNGLGAFDSAISYGTCFNDGGETCPSLSWAVVDDEDRGSVFEVTYVDEDAGIAAIFTEADPGLDMSSFAGGNLNFDVKVIDAGNNETGWIMKVDCVYPCTSNDQRIGTAGLDGWQTVSVPVSQLVEGGLDLSNVSTGLVIWPDPAGNEGFVYRIDNVYWGR